MQIESILPARSFARFKIGRTEYNTKESVSGILFALPCIVLSIIFVFLPIFISLMYAFTDANMLRLDRVTFVGLENFARAFEDPDIVNALRNTAIFVACVTPLQFGASLGLAVLLNRVRHCNTFLRWAFFIPVMLSLAVTSMLWMNLLNVQEGLINTFIEILGGERQGFLEDPTQALYCIVFISAWQGAGYQMLIFLSALQNIPKDLYEAASIDQASKWQQFIHITLPSIKPTMVFVLITMLIGAFRICIQPMVMTGGGPLGSTMTMSYYIYKTGIDYRDVGYSSAIALLYTFLIATVSLGLRKLLGGDNQK